MSPQFVLYATQEIEQTLVSKEYGSTLLMVYGKTIYIFFYKILPLFHDFVPSMLQCLNTAMFEKHDHVKTQIFLIPYTYKSKMRSITAKPQTTD